MERKLYREFKYLNPRRVTAAEMARKYGLARGMAINRGKKKTPRKGCLFSNDFGLWWVAPAFASATFPITLP
jgi:hypothetical protein